MHYEKTIVVSAAVLAVAGVVDFAGFSASAINGQGNQFGQDTGQGNGRGYQALLESRAGVVGMTADQLKTTLKTKTMSQIAKERGMSEKRFAPR